MSVPVQRYSRTEATRLLCAGVYLDIDFRSQVIEQLVQHEERPVAPSLGVDAVPVLAYALRARSQEVQTALLLLLVWAVFVAVDFGDGGSVPVMWSLIYAVLCMVLWSARAATGLGTAVYTLDRATLRKALMGRRKRLRVLVPLGPRLLLAGYWLGALVVFFTSGGGNWPAVFFPLLLVVPIWMHRAHVSGVMRHELTRAPFAGLPRARLPAGERYRRIGAAIAREQHAELTIYDPFRPFIGAGIPYEPWSFALELKRRASAEPGRAPLTSRMVIELIRPRLEALRQSAAATSRDRLKDLEIEEFVYLPVGVGRGEVSYEGQTVRQHLLDAVDEGGEARRHFLRIRVGAWDEQVVVSVLVRVHTQGGMLVLEVVPHILTPVRPAYRAVDVIAGRGGEDVLRDGVRALLTGPTASFAAAVSTVRTIGITFRTWLADAQHALPDGPVTSVRELGSSPDVSLFQEMDISRYVKTIQDRIASGVREALSSQGYETDTFEQQIVQVSEGGVFIGSMSGGAVAVGSGSQARHTAGGTGK
ncbi:hypothetical protein QMK19_11045 [Streptomyces sp. H10-C2]|uniref:hypothetical protein n=1 Tax=unclassified Streptomyces TaxID=2593676 RepID=UPI0024BB64FD|nr:MULTISPECIES: hypothetical protein [unclassified Streptomyces]MDJ0340546.1 hypothetical protein [Streptomyces sp. PH10-H1]MDJ0370194.1 hypothetical protein [Streptomyces sp. H10-C2]